MRFTVGQLLTARVETQGLSVGPLYRVVEVYCSPFSGFFAYGLRLESFPGNELIWVFNADLVLDAITQPAT